METSDLSGALGKLLSDPKALAGVMSMAQSLMGAMPGKESVASEATEAVPASAAAEKIEPPPMQESDNKTDSIPSAASLAALAPLLTKSSGSDPRCALLHALRPYMSHGRSEKIDTLVNMLKIAEIAGELLGGKLF